MKPLTLLSRAARSPLFLRAYAATAREDGDEATAIILESVAHEIDLLTTELNAAYDANDAAASK